MPSIQNLVVDLNNGSIVGVGPAPLSDDENNWRALSPSIRYSFVHIKASISAANFLEMENAWKSITFNGSYLHYDAACATIANMDVNRRIIVSGNFSGCKFVVYKVSPSEFKCAHISRPGTNSDQFVTLMDAYAKAQGWTVVREAPTVGLIGKNGCTGVVCVSQLITNRRVETIRLEMGALGRIVGRTMWSDNI